MVEKKPLIQLISAVLITLVILFFSSEIEHYSSLGYLGAFLISLLTSATLIIPAPGWIAVLQLGTILNPVILGIVCGIGAALGELTGYFAGSGIVDLMKKRQGPRFEKYKTMVRKNSFFTILILAFIPNPLFDFAGIAAGAVKMPLWQFLLACTIGKIGKFFLIAYLGWFSQGLF